MIISLFRNFTFKKRNSNFHLNSIHLNKIYCWFSFCLFRFLTFDSYSLKSTSLSLSLISFVYSFLSLPSSFLKTFPFPSHGLRFFMLNTRYPRYQPVFQIPSPPILSSISIFFPFHFSLKQQSPAISFSYTLSLSLYFLRLLFLTSDNFLEILGKKQTLTTKASKVKKKKKNPSSCFSRNFFQEMFTPF